MGIGKHASLRSSSSAAAFTIAVMLSGCATVRTDYGYYKGNTPDLQSADIAKFAQEQNNVIQQLSALAGTTVPTDRGDWRPLVDAGMQYADVRCSRYMDALFWLNRARETSSKQIEYVGAATSALLALVKATKTLIGIAPLGFGLVDQTVNNVGQGLLYNLDPSAVAALVAKQQATYRDAIKDTNYTTRVAALQAIQQYTMLCLPVNIEAQVNQAIGNSEFKAVNYRLPISGEEPTPATATTTTATTTTTTTSTPTKNENVIPVIQQQPAQGKQQ